MRTRPSKGGLRAERAIATPSEDMLDRCWFSEAVRKLGLTSELPVAIAVLGEWGTGKTSILRLIQHEMPERAVCLHYNAWKNECGPGSGHGLLRFLLAELTEDAEGKAQIPSLLEGFGERDVIGTDRFEDLLSQYVSKALKKRRAQRVVLLLDDLDRCRPDALISLLEALGLYVLASDIPVAVIATLDELRAARAYARALGLERDGEQEGRQHLTRVFSIMLGLPAVPADGWRAIIEDRFPVLKSKMSKDDRALLSNAIGLASYTVRELKHHLNQVAFWEMVAKGDAFTKSLPVESLLRWYFMTAHDVALWSFLSGNIDEARSNLEMKLAELGSVQKSRPGAARDQVLSNLFADTLLDRRNLERLRALGRHIGRMPTQPHADLDATGLKLKEASWDELRILADTAKTASDLAQVARSAASKPVNDINDCIICSNIAIVCHNRSEVNLAEVLFSKSIRALDDVEDPRPHRGTANILSAYINFLSQTGRKSDAKGILKRVDYRNPNTSRTALVRILRFARETKDGDLREPVFENLMAADDLDPDDFASAIREYLPQLGVHPEDVVPHIERLRVSHPEDALWQWACAEGFACVMLVSEDPKRFEAQFFECVEEALARLEDAVPDLDDCANAVARLADRRPGEVMRLLTKMREKGEVSPAALISIARSSSVLSSDGEFKRLLQEALPALER